MQKFQNLTRKFLGLGNPVTPASEFDDTYDTKSL